jgi:hypothetical protein
MVESKSRKRVWIAAIAVAVAVLVVILIGILASGSGAGGGKAEAARQADRTALGQGLTRPPNVAPGQPVPGQAFTEEMIGLMDAELRRSFGGWRPNNWLIGGLIPLDNVENYQLGVLSVIRRVSIVMREKLGRPGGGSDAFDPHVELAMNRFHSDETAFWFPDADKMFAEGSAQLKIYVENLKRGSAQFQPRTDNIYELLYAFRDILGDCHQQLIKTHEKDGHPVSMFKTDDYYYFSKGAAHAVLGLAKALPKEVDFEVRAKGGQLPLQEMIESLEQADKPGPWMVLDGDDNDLRANHRRNLAGWIGDARMKVITLMDTLNK